MSSSMDTERNKMLCYCLGVRYGRVIDVVTEEECKTVQQVTRLCKAGGGCRSCHPEIEELIADAKARRKHTGIRGVLSRVFGRRP